MQARLKSTVQCYSHILNTTMIKSHKSKSKSKQNSTYWLSPTQLYIFPK